MMTMGIIHSDFSLCHNPKSEQTERMLMKISHNSWRMLSRSTRTRTSWSRIQEDVSLQEEVALDERIPAAQSPVQSEDRSGNEP